MARPIEAPAPAAPAAAPAEPPAVARSRVAAWLRGAATADASLADVHFDARYERLTLIIDPDHAAPRLFAALAGAAPLIAGRAQTLGVNPVGLSLNAAAALRARIAWLDARPCFIEHWTAAANAVLPLHLASPRPAAYDRDVSDVFAYLGLPAADPRPMRAMNVSERRLTALARAALSRTPLVLADDPFAGLPDAAQRRAGDLLKQLARAGAAVVVAVRNAADGASFATPGWLLQGGALTPPGRAP
jgi:ABC-type multidrug transport system ATPase subunit